MNDINNSTINDINENNIIDNSMKDLQFICYFLSFFEGI